MEEQPLADALTVKHPREVCLITVAHGVNEFYSVALPPILPLLVADLDISYGQAGALITVFFVMYSIFQLPAGFLADKVGQTRLLSGGMILLSVGLFVVGTADSYPLMIGGQAIAGIGGSTYHPSGMSLISDLESGGTEGRAMGIHGLGGVIGVAFAPVLIGGLASVYDWRLALSVSSVIGIVYAVVFALLFTKPAILDTPDGETTNSSGEQSGLRGRAWALFATPLAWWVVGLFAISFIVSFEIGSVRTFAPAYLFTRVSESTTVANGIYFVMLVGAGIATIGAGNLADRFDRTAAGALIFGVSMLLLGATSLIPAIPGALLGWFFLLGIVLYAVTPLKNALIASYSEQAFSGSLFGLMVTASSLGRATGPVFFGVAAEQFGWLLTFPAIGLVSLAGVVVFLALARV